MASNKVKQEAKCDNAECSFLVESTDIQSMKQDLQELLSSFRSGHLKAFGRNDTINKMETIRNKQGKLARLHFDLNSQLDYSDNENSQEKLEKQQEENMSTLMGELEELRSAIKSLSSSGSSPSSSNKAFDQL